MCSGNEDALAWRPGENCGRKFPVWGKEAGMPAQTAPTGDELWALRDEARTARIRIKTSKGDIVFKFFADDAPLHSAAFIKLARAGFYDGLNFHRVEPGFVIQGGCPQRRWHRRSRLSSRRRIQRQSRITVA